MINLNPSPDSIERMIREAWERMEVLSNRELSFIAGLVAKLELPTGHPKRFLSRGQLVWLQSTHLRALSRTHSRAGSPGSRRVL